MSTLGVDSVKVRAKGWDSAMGIILQQLERLIAMTPTSELRNRITALNIEAMVLERYAREQKEVL